MKSKRDPKRFIRRFAVFREGEPATYYVYAKDPMEALRSVGCEGTASCAPAGWYDKLENRIVDDSGDSIPPPAPSRPTPQSDPASFGGPQKDTGGDSVLDDPRAVRAPKTLPVFLNGHRTAEIKGVQNGR